MTIERYTKRVRRCPYCGVWSHFLVDHIAGAHFAIVQLRPRPVVECPCGFQGHMDAMGTHLATTRKIRTHLAPYIALWRMQREC